MGAPSRESPQRQKAEDSLSKEQIEQLRERLKKAFDDDIPWDKRPFRLMIETLAKRFELIWSIMDQKKKQKAETQFGVINNSTIELENTKKQRKDQQLQLVKVGQEVERKKNQLKQTQQLVQKLRNQNKKLIQDYEQKMRQSKASLKSISPHRALEQDENTQIYLGELLHYEPDFKQYVFDILSLAVKRKPIHSKLVYRMDLLNRANFHSYVDNKPNLLLVVKLKNQYMLAAFHDQPLAQHMPEEGLGLIFSLSHHKCFKNKKRPISYDSTHLLFGNSELRILAGKNKIFSNFGINNGFYENLGQDVNILFGEGKTRQVEMEHYEILQVIFE